MISDIILVYFDFYCYDSFPKGGASRLLFPPENSQPWVSIISRNSHPRNLIFKEKLSYHGILLSSSWKHGRHLQEGL